ncbi:Cof-type HAD-IIB family hydrolase [Crassaminicella thermophila]|uniref:Cof-type HAD-IIB family hydrolase n=1 Tax=Crassaminicella thermophila TaxID=2599308 RepID=A0A5C0SGZ1_CRATE|nr:Cof-type HAD-IIB family hydrolase [Crassaminicella thermophila]QEK13460.1 Cof-type HAD-IIB family hydrolase [Crassaminicella thermophila]
MKYKAVISDLDGTLLNCQHRISDYTKEIINKVIEKGIKFFIATGRHHMDATYIGKQLGLDTTFITSNGARVHNEKREEIFSHDLDENIVREILAMDFDPEIHVNIYQGDRWLTEKENEWVNQFKNESGFFYELVNFKKLEDYKATKLFLICENYDKLERIREIIDERFYGKLNIAFSLPECLEIMPKGISKGMALKKVLKQYNIKPKEVIAFGDGLNDFEMLKTVGKGLIMGNAHYKLKEALPENEVIGTNDDDGVAKYLKEVFLT